MERIMILKSVRIIFIGSLLLLLPVCSLQAQVIFSTDFSAAGGYSDGPLSGQPAGADKTWQEGAGVPSEGYFEVADGAMVVSQLEGTEATWVYIEFPMQSSGDFTVTWEWQYVGPADGTVDVGFCISETENFNLDGDPNLTWNEQGVMSRMQQGSGGVIDCRNGDWAGGGGYEALTEFSYTDGKKVFMRYEIDIDQSDQVFNAYAQKEGEAEVLLAENFGFRRGSTTGLNAIAIWMSGDNAGTSCIIDNIVVAGGTSSVYEWELFN